MRTPEFIWGSILHKGVAYHKRSSGGRLKFISMNERSKAIFTVGIFIFDQKLNHQF